MNDNVPSRWNPVRRQAIEPVLDVAMTIGNELRTSTENDFGDRVIQRTIPNHEYVETVVKSWSDAKHNL